MIDGRKLFGVIADCSHTTNQVTASEGSAALKLFRQRSPVGTPSFSKKKTYNNSRAGNTAAGGFDSNAKMTGSRYSPHFLISGYFANTTSAPTHPSVQYRSPRWMT